MATLSPFSPPTNTSSSSTTPTNTGSSSGGLFNNSGNLSSLSPVHAFLATLSLLFVIFGALIGRSIQLRRRRAIAEGTHVPPPHNGNWQDDHLLLTPILWEVHIAPSHDPEKGWAEILPVAGATFVPVACQCQTPRPSRRASWSPQQLSRFARGQQSTAPPAVPDLPVRTPTAASASLESPEPPSPPLSEPVRLAVLISMPTRTTHGRVEHEIGRPPVVEFGVARVAYAHPAES
ncbi:hypothetical protein EI94DRAFT_1032776 [Lactarius quietus]|nr:hypothetical protein EI94DRAFT_1032776 [Lactarius quietus]